MAICLRYGKTRFQPLLKPILSHGEEFMNLNDKMLKLSVKIQTLLSDDRGQDLVEYALVVAIIALGATVAMKSLSNEINSVFGTISSKLSTAVPAS